MCVESDGPLWTRNSEGCPKCRRGLVGRLPAFEYIEPTAGRASQPLHNTMLNLGHCGEVDAYEIFSAA